MRTELTSLQRKGETSVQPLKKTTANGNTYSGAGTAEQKPFLKFAKNRIFKNEKVREENLCSLWI